MKAACSDNEFIELWRRLGAPSAVAKELKIAPRNAMERRCRLEQKYGIVLPTMTGPNRRAIDIEIGSMYVHEASQFIDYRIESGLVLVGSDAHYAPGHASVAHRGLVAAVKALKPTAVILNGDLLDGGGIGKFQRYDWSNPPTVKQELEAVQERIGEISAAAPPGMVKLRTIGNHDSRFDARLANAAPQYEGIPGTRLKDHLPDWQDALRIHINTDTVVLHDWHGGLHAGWNNTVKSGGFHVITGHTHHLECKPHVGFGGIRYGIETGMLADEEQRTFDYRRGKPGLNWQSGFAVLTWRDGTLLYPEFATVHDGQCFLRGEPLCI